MQLGQPSNEQSERLLHWLVGWLVDCDHQPGDLVGWLPGCDHQPGGLVGWLVGCDHQPDGLAGWSGGLVWLAGLTPREVSPLCETHDHFENDGT